MCIRDRSGTSLSTYRAMKRAKKHGCHIASMSGRDDNEMCIRDRERNEYIRIFVLF